MFTPKYIKEGKLLLKGVTKFIHYKRDILSEEKLADITAHFNDFERLLKGGDREAIQAKSKELQRVCERSVPMASHSAMRENVEVFFVAIVIALGIRSYFLQPFKIPTGSMQPTLNGIIGFPVTDQAEWDKTKPSVVGRTWDLLWHGRNYVDAVAEEDFRVTNIYQRDRLKFFSFTVIEREGKKPLTLWAPMDQVINDFGFGRRIGLSGGGRKGPIDKDSGAPRLASGTSIANPLIRKGEVIARGYIDTGDQVLVNKLSYHFRKPSRGEVFVFTTKEIVGLNEPGQPSQHYIKRLCAVPGDSWSVEPPNLLIDGEIAKEEGPRRVMAREGVYKDTGYRANGSYLKGTLGPKQYLALGDNSPRSLDSRFWGPVPEKNVVGPALFVYWPFAKHWGRIH